MKKVPQYRELVYLVKSTAFSPLTNISSDDARYLVGQWSSICTDLRSTFYSQPIKCGSDREKQVLGLNLAECQSLSLNQ